LRALGDLAPESLAPPREQANVLDAELSRALASFQSRHGLAADGVLGRGTFRALTVPLDRRVRQIELSLERLRWLPPRIGSPPIVVNIPQFELFAFRTTEDREDSLLAMDVIVGKSFPRNNTPVFAADMRYIVLRPYWDVPSSILRGELLPKIRVDPVWIERNSFEIVSGPGDDSPVVPATPENLDLLAAGRLRLRQKPGPGNSLGLVKFMFPNRYSVYLHGTPAQSLFAQARRDFSHGCVRVADPVALASFVLRDDPRWTRESLEAAMLAGGPTRIVLGVPVRVFLIYATALATERGRVLFFEDIYGHDARLERLLASRRS
jgi:murein L,D-transpeptidase YcbB/YkuD